ncbi:hypothetical protein XA68_13407 [Ophiocordyceps unilateralis]|uniref:Uncharacterized protein n=1 Tax=Ophiocordyceps unilateralis TaxID=268505 RepID=A0A2A9PCC9_OPHUN|nr:hypothetical protein XA68_13407 [Ophiocordyceps unilateralis]
MAEGFLASTSTKLAELPTFSYSLHRHPHCATKRAASPFTSFFLFCIPIVGRASISFVSRSLRKRCSRVSTRLISAVRANDDAATRLQAPPTLQPVVLDAARRRNIAPIRQTPSVMDVEAVQLPSPALNGHCSLDLNHCPVLVPVYPPRRGPRQGTGHLIFPLFLLW